MEQATYLAVLTPLGRGAIATIGVRGPRAVEIVGRRFAPVTGRPLAAMAVGRVLLGSFRSEHDACEEMVVGLVGQDEVEVHCHGGTAAVNAAAAALVAEGAERIAAEEWTHRAASDAIAAEAWLALAAARTERTAGILLDQTRGALTAAIGQIRRAIDEGDLSAAQRQIAALLCRAEVGLRLTQPWQVVLAGPPNVGKSSLINALVGYERAIVFDQPGTTRDVLTAPAAFDGWPVELSDTAGLRIAGDAIEAAGVERARQQAAAADLVLLVCDPTLDWPRVPPLPPAGPRLIVHNKSDLGPPPADGRPAGIAVSARTGEGLDRLIRAIVERLVPEPPEPGAAVPFTQRQALLLAAMQDALQAGDPAAAAATARQFFLP